MPIDLTTVPKEICVIRLSAIGDTCHALPVVRTLKAHWPAARITWIIGRIEATLMKGIEDAELVVFDKSRGLRAYRDLRSALRGRRFDLLLHMQASLRANVVAAIAGGRVRVGFDRRRGRDFQWLFTNSRIPSTPRQHVMDGLFEFAAHVGAHERVLRWNIPVAEADRRFAAGHVASDRPTLVISPCSSQRFRNFRNWRAENYVAVADYAAERYAARIVLCGGDSALEQQYGEAIENGCRTDTTNLIGRTSLKQLLCVLDAATALISPDSGPAHMANAVGTPVIGLYATSNRLRTGPYCYQDLVVDRYPMAVEREFGKTRDELPWGQRVRDPRAMDLIKVEDVKQKLDTVFSTSNSGTTH